MAKKKCVIVEPSALRAHETYILGPFSRIGAWLIACRELVRHPTGSVWVAGLDSFAARKRKTWK